MQVILISGYLEVALDKAETDVAATLKKIVSTMVNGVTYVNAIHVLMSIYEYDRPLSFSKINSFTFEEQAKKFYDYYEIHNKFQFIVSKEQFDNQLVCQQFHEENYSKYQVFGNEVRFYKTAYKEQEFSAAHEVGVQSYSDASVGD